MLKKAFDKANRAVSILLKPNDSVARALVIIANMLAFSLLLDVVQLFLIAAILMK